ncbi:ABC transporter permease [Sphingobacterium hungaricum]|uniref:ABC transporter permease n=1 Tax=Sphingobacterium hungaricum TaxID=2082723 RepID=A0A928V035_9SPHI|nr:ABC transporter permease [Sphingobacterium hungaricum]MBE8714516.1 ABC transporter permease [Sphingobacterium hungaricum]
MNKILLIIQREYLSRVKKKSFLLITFIFPILFIGGYAAVIYFSIKSKEDKHAFVRVIDEQGSVANQLENNKNLTFVTTNESLQQEIAALPKNEDKGNTNLLYIPKDFYESRKIEFLSAGKPNISIQGKVSDQLSDIIKTNAYKSMGINADSIKSVNSDVIIASKEVLATGEEKDGQTGIAMGIAFVLCIIIYFAVFLYGVQVMRGVIEEKTSRIIEVIISSVKPFQLMMGKIVGIGMVGITQFLLWIILSTGLLTVATTFLINKEDVAAQMTQNSPIQDVEKVSQSSGFDFNTALESINFPEIITCFLIFFIGGYLLYSALFAAVGSAVDSETEANQFTMPITLPLLITYALSFAVLTDDPNGTLATWLSFIPFTSPIAMIVRIPFGVPLWEIITSAVILFATFIFVAWVAARIYRVGILMYGKKASFKEMIKWFNYKA